LMATFGCCRWLDETTGRDDMASRANCTQVDLEVGRPALKLVDIELDVTWGRTCQLQMSGYHREHGALSGACSLRVKSPQAPGFQSGAPSQ
jgi:hypothetical protein